MPRFVILEHQWRGVHWDFMLESAGMLRTWAIDAPLRPDADLPARALGDHRMAYLDYEGPVSGDRGTVRRVAQGEYRAIVWEAARVVVELRGDQLSGSAELRLVEASGDDPNRGIWALRLGNVD